MSLFKNLTLLGTFGTVCLTLGCTSKPPELVQASGKVFKADGSPMKIVRVEFWPQENAKSFTTLPYALTNEKGEFELVMLDPDKPGAPPGKYRVTVIEFPKPAIPTIPAKYGSDQSTPWEVTIPSKGTKEIQLKIDS